MPYLSAGGMRLVFLGMTTLSSLKGCCVASRSVSLESDSLPASTPMTYFRSRHKETCKNYFHRALNRPTASTARLEPTERPFYCRLTVPLGSKIFSLVLRDCTPRRCVA